MNDSSHTPSSARIPPPPHPEAIPPSVTTTTGTATSSSTTPTSQTQSVSKRKNHSIAWDHFTLMKNPDGTPMPKQKQRAKCNHCPQTYSCVTKNGTTNMKNHLLYQCSKSPINVPKRQRHIVQESVGKGGRVVAWSYDEDVSRLALARMVVKDELPFSFVEGPGFKDFISQVQPQFKKFSRRTVARDIWELYEVERISIKNILATYGQRVSLTTDTWTSVQNINYMVLTAHFIDEDWVLHKRILNFCVIPNQKGKTIGQLIETCLIGWGIEKIFCIVVDNASPNQVAIDYMKDKIKNWNELVLDGEFLHLRCCCHILNLVVKDGMAELDSSIESIRNCVKYIRSSPSRLERFRKCAVQEKVKHKGMIVPLDVCTRWNSTYLMLDIAIKYRKAFIRMLDEDPQFEACLNEKGGNPGAQDWDKAERLVKFLKIFYDATLDFSGTQVVTSNQPIRWMCTIITEMDKCIKGNDKLLGTIAKSMKEKFDKYWGFVENLNKILLIAIVLDPRYKVLYLDYFFPKLQKDKTLVAVMVTNVKSTLQELFNEYATNDPEAALAFYNSTQQLSASYASVGEEDSHAASLNEFIKLRHEKDVVEVRTEVDKYLLDPSEDPKNPNFQLLVWWKENACRYPILSQIARDVFAVPASTVASESAFSLGSRILDPFRASLTPKMVEALVCTSDWLRDTSKPMFSEPVKEELEDYSALENLTAESIVTTNAASLED